MSQGNPNVIASHSPRLPYSATLGHRAAMGSNPNGVSPPSPETNPVRVWIAPQPFRVAGDDWPRLPLPRVAEYGNPGLKCPTPFGVAVRGLAAAFILHQIEPNRVATGAPQKLTNSFRLEIALPSERQLTRLPNHNSKEHLK